MQDTSEYVKGADRKAEDLILAQAREILQRRICKKEDLIPGSTEEVAALICAHIGGNEHESFGVMFLGLRGEMISLEVMFRGSHTMVATHTREIAKAALAHNAAAIVIFHNHPTADGAKPSSPDISMTRALSEAMDMIEVKLVDHIVVSGNDWTSLAQKQLMRTKRLPPEFRGMPKEIMDLIEMLRGGAMGIDQ